MINMNENDTMSWVVMAYTFNPRAGFGTAKDTERNSVSKNQRKGVRAVIMCTL